MLIIGIAGTELAAQERDWLQHDACAGVILFARNFASRAQAAEFTQGMWVRLGLDPDEPSTWDRERIHMPSHRREPVATFAPRVSPSPARPPPPSRRPRSPRRETGVPTRRCLACARRA